MIARRLTKLAHVIARNNQYGYEEGISTTYAIIKIERYIEQTDANARLKLMGLSAAFGAISRKLL